MWVIENVEHRPQQNESKIYTHWASIFFPLSTQHIFCEEYGSRENAVGSTARKCRQTCKMAPGLDLNQSYLMIHFRQEKKKLVLLSICASKIAFGRKQKSELWGNLEFGWESEGGEKQPYIYSRKDVSSWYRVDKRRTMVTLAIQWCYKLISGHLTGTMKRYDISYLGGGSCHFSYSSPINPSSRWVQGDLAIRRKCSGILEQVRCIQMGKNGKWHRSEWKTHGTKHH